MSLFLRPIFNLRYAHTHTHTLVLLQDGNCRINATGTKCGVQISKFYTVPSGNVSALVMAIAENGPIGVAIDASHKSFSFYSHGVYYEPACGECG